MAQPPTSQGAVLVISLWFEPDAAGGAFRARLIWTGDVRDPGESVVVKDPEMMLELVRTWSSRAQARAGDPEGRPQP